MKLGLQLIILFTLLGESIYCQMKKDVFPLSREFRKDGFYIAPLGTVSVGNKIEGVLRDTAFNYEYETLGRGTLGYGAELGWYYTFKDYQIGDFFEGGISYRRYTGEGRHEGVLSRDTLTSQIQTISKYKAQFITASFRIMDVVNLKPETFFIWGFGVNYNYLFGSSYEREVEYPNSFETFQNKNSFQGHFQAGYGFKVSKKILLIPTIETPIFTLYPTGDLNPAFTFFGARYQPIIVGLRFMFLRDDPVNCNTPTLMPVPGG